MLNIKNNLTRNAFLLYAFIFAAIFTSCSNTEEIDDQIVEQVQYELEDGVFITVKLSDSHLQQSRYFKSLDDYYDHLEQLEKTGEPILVNKSLYEKLGHYFNPMEISLMDDNSQIEIGDKTYRADGTAAYELNEAGQWDKIVHYGEDGNTDLDETSMVYNNLGQLHLLKSYQFESPEAQRIYDNMLASKDQAKTETIHRKTFVITYVDLIGRNPFPCVNCNLPATVRYRYNGITYSAQLRAVVWNQEYSNWGTRAKSGTALQVKDFSSSGRFTTDWTIPSDGTRMTTDSGSGYRPYVYLKHVTSDNGGSNTKYHVEKFGYKWQVTASGKRKNRWKTLSNHYINFRDPSGPSGLGLRRIKTVNRFD
ncbi:MAG: hypothetical protein AAFQ94_16070 [Bacteroidota bacterium]